MSQVRHMLLIFFLWFVLVKASSFTLTFTNYAIAGVYSLQAHAEGFKMGGEGVTLDFKI